MSVARTAVGLLVVALAACGAPRAPTRGAAVTPGKAGAGVAIGATEEEERASDPAAVARAAVEEVISRYGGPEWCYDDALRQSEVEGKLTFGWDVTAAGEATRVRLVTSTLRPVIAGLPPVASSLPACIATQIARWRFPPQVRGRSVTYTFTFRRWWAEPASRPARATATEQVADLPEREWEYRIGGRYPPREPRIGPPRPGTAPGSMPAPAASNPVRGTVPWAGPVVRPRSCADVHRVRERLVQSLAAIEQCYARERKRSSRLEGRLDVKVVIAADGTTSAAIDRSTFGPEGAGLVDCVTTLIRGWRFTPRKGCEGTTTAAFPLIFNPP